MRTIIVCASPQDDFTKIYQPLKDDYIIAVDDGYLTLEKLHIIPNLLIGDFDGKFVPSHQKNIKIFPSKKNETDLELALMQVNNTSNVLIYNATGGRLDHFLLNVKLLEKYSDLNIKIIDEINEISLIKKSGKYVFDDEYQYFSIIPITDCEISLTNFLYPLNKMIVTTKDTYTTSNEPIGEGIMELFKGTCLIIRSHNK